MTKFCVEGMVIERLKEKGLNVPGLLREYVSIRKHKIKKIEEDILHATENLNKVIRTLEDAGIMTAIEIIQLLEDAGMIVERIEQ